MNKGNKAIWCFIIAGISAGGLASSAKAQGALDALTPSSIVYTNGSVYSPYPVGFVVGGIGWTFTPSQDLLVTAISSSAQQVSFWQGTTQVFTNYDYLNANAGDQIIPQLQSITPLLLFAGHNYGVSTQVTNNPPTFAVFLCGSQSGTNGTGIISVSPYLNGFGSFQISTVGQWSPYNGSVNPDNVVLGANFEFQVVPEPRANESLFLAIALCIPLSNRYSILIKSIRQHNLIRYE